MPANRHADHLRVLFIGNSFTNYWGGVPLNVTALVSTTPDWRPERPPLFEETTYSGATLRSHWDMKVAAERIREGAWDYVVLQGNSQEPLLTPEDFHAYGRRFAEEARKVNSKPVLFMTWPYVGRPEDGPRLTEEYESLGREIEADVVPVGVAFTRAADLGLPLIEADTKHPTRAGAYLIACCFYSFFYDRPATGATGAIDDALAPGGRWIDLPDDIAAKLQRVAYDVVHAWREQRAGPRREGAE